MTTIERPSGQAILAALDAAAVEFVVALPDIVTSEGVLWPLALRGRPRLVRICKEDEGVSICAGLSFTGKRAVLMMQQTGLMDSLNAIRAIGMEYRLPIAMLVGLQGKEPHLKPRASASYGVRIIEPVLDAMGVPHHLVEEPGDVGRIAPAIDAAYARSMPVCILIGRNPTP